MSVVYVYAFLYLPCHLTWYHILWSFRFLALHFLFTILAGFVCLYVAARHFVSELAQFFLYFKLIRASKVPGTPTRASSSLSGSERPKQNRLHKAASFQFVSELHLLNSDT